MSEFMESYPETPLNPWFSMWTEPRATIRQIIRGNPERHLLILASFMGVSQALNQASARNLGDKLAWPWPLIIIIAAFLGPVIGMIGIYISGASLHWTGKWIGGTASPKNIRAAIAWSNVPAIWALFLWIPELVLFRGDLFTWETPWIDAHPFLALLLLAFGLVEMVIGIWVFFVFLHSLGEVQGFSAWKAFGNSFLASLIILVPAVVIGIVVTVFIVAMV